MFGTPERFWADVTLLTYLLLITPLMLLGFYFARRKMFFPHHKMTMTAVLMLNWLLIIAVMLRSFAQNVSPGIPEYVSEIPILLPLVHMFIGSIAQLMATYLVILMWTERTPYEKLVPFRIQKIKTPMRITLSLWLITIVMGLGIYTVWLPSDTATDAPVPAATEEALESTEEAVAPSVTEEVSTATEESVAPAATEEAAVVDPYAAPVTTEQALDPYAAPVVSSTEEALAPASTEDSDESDDDNSGSGSDNSGSGSDDDKDDD